MLGTTHQIGGITAATITTTALYVAGFPLARENPELLPAIIVGGWVGGLIPDIDHPNSKISRFKVLGFPVFKPLAWIIFTLFGHRGATHTLWSLFLTSLPFMLAPLFLPANSIILSVLIALFGIGYAVGYFSHLLLDSLTPSGTPFVWPLPTVHLGQLPTGKYDELVQVCLILILLFSCWSLFYATGTPIPKIY